MAAGALFLCSTLPSLAETPVAARSELVNPVKAMGSASAGLRAGTNAEIKTASLQSRALLEIQRRTTALQELSTRINALKRVSSSTKGILSSEIQTEIANLVALQTKIQNDTDSVTLKADVQSIITSYRVFALFMPQVRLLDGADALNTTSEKLSSLSASLQTRLAQAQSSGKDVSSLQSLLTSMQAENKNAQAQSAAITTEITSLTPAGYPGNKTTLEAARTKLQTGTKDLKTAGQNARQIIQTLLTMSVGNNSTSGNSSSASSLLKPGAVNNLQK